LLGDFLNDRLFALHCRTTVEKYKLVLLLVALFRRNHYDRSVIRRPPDQGLRVICTGPHQRADRDLPNVVTVAVVDRPFPFHLHGATDESPLARSTAHDRLFLKLRRDDVSSLAERLLGVDVDLEVELPAHGLQDDDLFRRLVDRSQPRDKALVAHDPGQVSIGALADRHVPGDRRIKVVVHLWTGTVKRTIAYSVPLRCIRL